MADKVKSPKDKGKVRVLVYGTLKEGHANHILLSQANAEFIGYDSTTGPYRMYDLGGFPATCNWAGKDQKIRGELYAINSEALAALDLLEGHPHFFCRRKIWTDVHDRRAWIYILAAPDFVHRDADVKVAGMWRGSKPECQFWIQRNKEQRDAASA